jgi:hypothetical protein
MKTLEITSGIYFCNKSASATATLFNPINGRTASGTFKKLKNQIRFFDLSGKLFASLVKNKHGEILLVSATNTEKGCLYSFALCTADEKTLGLSGLSYSENTELIEKLWETASACS